MDYIVSSHGGFQAATGVIDLPENITVKFFVADGAVLSNDRLQNVNAWGLYSHLKAGMALEGNQQYVNSRVTQTVFPEGRVKNYNCWAMTEPDLAPYSGIYQVGGQRINAIPHPMSLQDVINLVGHDTPTTIYWVACRSLYV